jgi:fructokinase
VAGLEGASAEQVVEALRFGAALAAWNCGFEGARGGMYAVSRAGFERAVRRILAGQAPEPVSEAPAPAELEVSGSFCPGCSGGPAT